MIAEAEDQATIEAIERWYIFNRDPSDEHWRNIDVLLHAHKEHIGKFDAEIDRLADDYEATISDLEAEHRAEIEELKKDHEREINSYEEHIRKLTEASHARDEKIAELKYKITETTMRCEYYERVATRQADILGADHVKALADGMHKLMSIDK